MLHSTSSGSLNRSQAQADTQRALNHFAVRADQPACHTVSLCGGSGLQGAWHAQHVRGMDTWAQYKQMPGPKSTAIVSIKPLLKVTLLVTSCTKYDKLLYRLLLLLLLLPPLTADWSAAGSCAGWRPCTGEVAGYVEESAGEHMLC
jgi:hypothetical protein